MPVAGAQVIVDETDRLHEGIANGGPHELEVARSQIAGESFRQGSLRRDFARVLPRILYRGAIHKRPKIMVETAKSILHLEIGAGVADGGSNFGTVANDAGISHQAHYLGFAKGSHAMGIESRKSAAIIFAFAQHGYPGKARLRTFQQQKFKQDLVVMLRYAPLGIVVGHVKRVIAAPGAALRGEGGYGIWRIHDAPHCKVFCPNRDTA